MTKFKNMITVMCILCITTISGQEAANIADRRTSLEFGLKAGLNISNIWDSENEEFTSEAKAGFAGGAFIGIPIGKFIGVQPEILISQKGFNKGTGTLLLSPYTFTRTQTYLDIPLQLQLKPAKFITIVAGPQFSYLLDQTDKYTFGSNSTEQKQEFDNENIRKNILGFVAGADLIIDHFVISGRAALDFQTNNGDGTSKTPRYKNQWFQLTAGYIF
jgi:hypothetical protein